MKLMKYWARASESVTQSDGQNLFLTRLAGSNESLGDANQNAATALKALKDRITGGLLISQSQEAHYEYGHHGEIREDVIETFTADDGTVIAGITRNRYGALVLNAATVLFADVDAPPPQPRSFVEILSGLFKKTPSREERYAAMKTQALDGIKAFAATRPDLGLRVYETHSGYRVVVTNAVFTPESDASKTILDGLQSDPLFQALCLRQNCYRARLTAKPFRCGMDNPRGTFPRTDPADIAAYDAWLSRYETATKGTAACRKIIDLGPSDRHADVDVVLNIHDHYAQGSSQTPLA